MLIFGSAKKTRVAPEGKARVSLQKHLTFSCRYPIDAQFYATRFRSVILTGVKFNFKFIRIKFDALTYLGIKKADLFSPPDRRGESS